MDRAFTQSTSIFSPIPVRTRIPGRRISAICRVSRRAPICRWDSTIPTPRLTIRPPPTARLSASGFQARFTQHLLQGFGFAPNTRFIRIAKNNREISDIAFRLQIITTVDQIENMYWDLVFAYENVRVQNESLAFAQKTLSDTKKQVEIGTLAPIEVVRAQSTVATDQQALTVAQTNLQLQQLLMKNALSRTLVDPRLADAEVIPTSTMQLPATEPVVPTQDLVNDALTIAPNWRRRVSIWRTRRSATRQFAIRCCRVLDLFAYYGGTGIGGNVALPHLSTRDWRHFRKPASIRPRCASFPQRWSGGL